MKPASEKIRLDVLLVERGLAESREKAQALIMAGQVLVDGKPAGKAGRLVAAGSRLEVLAGLPYVSRAGKKLEAALEYFGVSPQDKVCLDVGASTGGFTDCLLQRGARRVYAVDVGAGLLDWRLRNDPRVVVREGINARYLRPEDIGEPVHLATCDVSFISVTLILPPVAATLDARGELIILIKPQFEVGRRQVGKGGIVRDPELHAWACNRVEQAARSLGLETHLMPDPVFGAEGNKEFLLYAHR